MTFLAKPKRSQNPKVEREKKTSEQFSQKPFCLATLVRLERTTFSSAGKRSNPLSYRVKLDTFAIIPHLA